MTDVLASDYRIGTSEDEDASLDFEYPGTAYGNDIWTPDQIAAHLNRTGGQWGDGANDLLQQGGDTAVINFGFHENQQSLFDNGYVYTNPVNGRLTAFSEYFQFGAFTEALVGPTAPSRDAHGDQTALVESICVFCLRAAGASQV